MNKIAFFFITFLIGNALIGMDRVALIAQALEERQEEAAQVSKKIYLGLWRNQMEQDVIIEYPYSGGKNRFLFKRKTWMSLDLPVLLTQLKGKPDYLATVTIDSTQIDQQNLQMQMRISLALTYSDGSKKFATSSFPAAQDISSEVDLIATNASGITIDGIIEGEGFVESTVVCQARTRP